MTRIFTLTFILLAAATISVGCSRQPTVPVAEFGDTVRTVMESQIHDVEAALHPTPDAVEGSDPDRLNNAVEAYRQGDGQSQPVQQPVTVSVGQ